MKFFLILIVYIISKGYLKKAKFELKSTWKRTSFSTEACEFFSHTNYRSFWTLLDNPITFSNSQEEFNILKNLLNEKDEKLFEFSLSINYFTPLVTTMQKLGEKVITKIDKEIKTFAHCSTGQVFTNLKDLKLFLSQKKIEEQSLDDLEIFSFDHVYQNNDILQDNKLYCILYGEVNSNEVNEYHQLLSQKVKEGKMNYIFRHFYQMDVSRLDFYSSKEHDDLLSLQGYGIELQIKDLEYRTTDPKVVPKSQLPDEIHGVVFKTLLEKYKDQNDELNSFRSELMKESQKLDFNVWEISDLGYRISQMIKDSDSELGKLKEISQNFLTIMNDAKNYAVSSDMKKEVEDNQKLIGEGTNKFFVNDKLIDTEKISIFHFYDMIKEEQSFYNQVQMFNLTKNEVNGILQSSTGSKETSRFDLISQDSVFWVNDIESDKRYSNFPKRVKSILQPAYMGRRTFARRNMFNFIIFVDPTTEEGIDLMRELNEIIGYGAPFRFGLVFFRLSDKEKEEKKFVDVDLTGGTAGADFTLDDTAFAKLLCVFQYISEKRSVQEAVKFVVYLLDSVKQDGTLSEEVLIEEFSKHAPRHLSYDEVIKEEKYYHYLDDVVYSLIRQNHKSQFVTLNGLFYSLENENLNNAIMKNLNQEFEYISELVKSNVIADGTKNILSFLLENNNAFKRYNYDIFNKVANNNFPTVDVNKSPLDNLHYFKKDSDEISKFTYYLCLDFQNNQEESISTIINLIDHVLSSNDIETSNSRFGVLNHSPDVNEKILNSVYSLVHSSKTIEDLESNLRMFDPSLKIDSLPSSFMKILEEQSNFCNNFGENSFILVNGNTYSISSISSMNDFGMIEHYYYDLVNSVSQIIESKVDIDLSKMNELVFGLSSLMINSLGDEKRDTEISSSLQGEYCSISMNEDVIGPKLVAFVDPLSKFAQKFSEYFIVWGEYFKFPLQIYLNPVKSVSELPIKSWYRFLLKPNLLFNEENGEFIDTNYIYFDNIISNYILTTYTDEPESWLLELTYAKHDLDNINMDYVEEEMKVRYQLENIVVTGSCFDVTKKQSPRGLQFVLEAENVKKQGTLVMANLGYFQLKANPNVFHLTLSEGRHNELYGFQSISQTTFYNQNPSSYQKVVDSYISVALTHFDGPFFYVNVKRMAGKEDEELLVEEKKEGFFDRVKGKIYGKNNGNQDEEKETINVFSVASGHLYERLLKIMMKSATKSTKRSRIKFWIIKNYLSPQFKEYMPYMAERYDFDFEFVTYKWPSWLHKQKNKIRIIWSYKALFLDVLFPLDVKRIIYVDSDQVTRGDLTELWEMDLKGNSVAYTPFCNDKPEMDGYAFWKQGYWSNHLRGKSYHISALYIVDVHTFRRIYAGDQYRVIYDNLSKDPNSLSNLDQDLPNFAQHMIPIYSLPQEWLWCETWCSQKSKLKAKTIDLCNNPQTKEHKVSQARRIVNVDNDWPFNWEDYHVEIIKFTEEVEKKLGYE